MRELLSLLNQPAVLQQGVRDGTLTISHVRVLRQLAPEEQVCWYQVVQDDGLSARALQERVAAAKVRPEASAVSSPAAEPAAPPAVVADETPPARNAGSPSIASNVFDLAGEPPLSPREERRLAQVLAAYPHLPHLSAEAMIRFVGQNPFGQEVLDPLQHALDHLPPDLADLTGSQAMTLVATLTPLVARLAQTRDAVQSNLESGR